MRSRSCPWWSPRSASPRRCSPSRSTAATSSPSCAGRARDRARARTHLGAGQLYLPARLGDRLPLRRGEHPRGRGGGAPGERPRRPPARAASGAAAGAGGAARGVVERGAADVLHARTVWRSIPFLLLLAACGGVRLEDRTTAPALPASALEVVAALDYPPGTIAVSPTGRVFFTLHPNGDPPIK